MAQKRATSRGTESQAENSTVRSFIEGLRLLEEGGEQETLLRVFSDGCSVCNVQLEEPMRGVEGARRFWHDYRHTFKEVSSRFTRIIESGDVAVLEWTSMGTLETGRPIEYRGVTILTLERDKVADFMSYFDSRPFTAHL